MCNGKRSPFPLATLDKESYTTVWNMTVDRAFMENYEFENDFRVRFLTSLSKMKGRGFYSTGAMSRTMYDCFQVCQQGLAPASDYRELDRLVALVFPGSVYPHSGRLTNFQPQPLTNMERQLLGLVGRNTNKMSYSKEIPLKFLLSRSGFSHSIQGMILDYIPDEQTAFDDIFGSMTEAQLETMTSHEKNNGASGKSIRCFEQICAVGMNRATYPIIQRMMSMGPIDPYSEFDIDFDVCELLDIMLMYIYKRCKLLGLSLAAAMCASSDVIRLNERAFAGLYGLYYPDVWLEPGRHYPNRFYPFSRWEDEYHKPSENWASGNCQLGLRRDGF